VLNIDLIYGIDGQTAATWMHSLDAALAWRPEEIYLYPLYVRPLTGLGRRARDWDDQRLTLYGIGRDHLLAEGYEQVSMRMFRRTPVGQVENLSYGSAAPRYCCQEDGMVGLGCGARSYTRGLHYALDYAVAPKGVKGIIADYLAHDAAEFATAEHGFTLDPDEQRRRYLLQSVLNVDGLDESRYRLRFGTDPADDFPDLHTFADVGLLDHEDGHWRPTAIGLERSDALGPWFFSDRVRALMAGYAAK
jgi:oxygen-independent coproporphyrinogen III oxidase